MNKIKMLISNIHFLWSDLFLLLGLMFAAIFCSFTWTFMVTADTNEVFLKPWMIIVAFILNAVCWGIYAYLEYKRGNRPNRLITILFIFFVLWGILAIAIQPEYMELTVVVRNVNGSNFNIITSSPLDVQAGDIVSGTIHITWVHKMFFMMTQTIISTLFFLVYFMFAKRVKSIKFITLVSVTVFAFLAILIIYSYITEWDHYIPFLKALFGQGTIQDVYDNSVFGFMVHRVPYGVCMMMGLVFALECHALYEKWYWYLVIAFLYINMIFSYCKTALLITAILILVYVLFRLWKTYKKHKKRNKIILISFASIAGLLIILTGISYITQGRFLSPIYKVILSVTESQSLDMRSYIWDNTFQLMQGGWWIVGRGFGTVNQMLYFMNNVNGDNVCPSHSTYNAVLGEGGIVFLFGFLVLIGYSFYMFIRCYKKKPQLALAMFFGPLAFLIYSITEGLPHLICVFLFPLFVLYNTIDNEIDNN